MKNIILFVGFICILFSCEKQENTAFLESREASLVAAEYLSLVDNQYVLNLTQEEAILLGISDFDYQRITKEIKCTNAEILKHLDDPNFIITEPNAQNEDDTEIPLVSTRIKTKTEVSSPRTIQTSGQEVGTDGGWAPMEAKEVHFNCFTYAAIAPIYQVTTKSLGHTFAKSQVGVIGKNILIVVPIAASNTDVTVTFQTSDSNGGMCTWNFDNGDGYGR